MGIIRNTVHSLATETALHYLSKRGRRPVAYIAANLFPYLGGLAVLVWVLEYPVEAALMVLAVLFVVSAMFIKEVHLRVIDLQGALPPDFIRIRNVHIESGDDGILHIEADGTYGTRP